MIVDMYIYLYIYIYIPLYPIFIIYPIPSIYIPYLSIFTISHYTIIGYTSNCIQWYPHHHLPLFATAAEARRQSPSLTPETLHVVVAVPKVSYEVLAQLAMCSIGEMI